MADPTTKERFVDTVASASRASPVNELNGMRQQ